MMSAQDLPLRPSQERWPWHWVWPRAAPPTRRGRQLGPDQDRGRRAPHRPVRSARHRRQGRDRAGGDADQRRRRRPGPRPRGDHQGRQDRRPAVGDRVQPAGRGPRATPPILSSSNVAASTAIGPSAESNKIPTIALGPVSAFKDGSNDYAFTCVAIPELYAEAMVDYLESEGIESLADRLHVGGPLRQDRQRPRPSRLPRRRASTWWSTSRSTSRRPTSPRLISKVKAAEPDAFLVWVAGPAAVIITKQFAGSGIPLLMTGAQASNLYVEPAGGRGRGRRDDQQHRCPGTRAAGRPAQGRRRRVRQPVAGAERRLYPPQFAFDGAAGIQLLVAAIEKAESADREKVRDALGSLDLLTPIGRFKFSEDDHGGIGKDAIAIVEVKDGEFKATPYSLEAFQTSLPE